MWFESRYAGLTLAERKGFFLLLEYVKLGCGSVEASESFVLTVACLGFPLSYPCVPSIQCGIALDSQVTIVAPRMMW